jgi:DNA-binding CsgD family transcriptional regulator
MAESPVALHAASPAELKERIEAERLGMSFLIYRDVEGHQHIYTLEDTAHRKITVGRAPAVDVALAWDLKISGLHAELERVGDDWVIIDDGLSRNGTFVNGERLHGRQRLLDGDALRFGSTLAVYRAPEGTEYGSTLPASSIATVASVSDTQRRILVALCRPFKGSPPVATPATNQQIADEMFLSVDAVKTHMRALFQKFGVEQLPQNQKRARLVELAFRSGLILERDL